MKLYHFAILFLLIAFTLFVTADIKANQLSVISEDIEKLDEAFQKATDDGVKDLVEVSGMDHLIINKEKSVNDFLTSMYAALGITDNRDKQELLKRYIPVIGVTCEDGYYMYYTDEYVGSDGYYTITKRWSEKQPYYYEDEDFIYRFNLNDMVTLYDKHGLLDSTKQQLIFTLNYKELSSSSVYEEFRQKRPDSFLLNDETFYLVRREHIVHVLEQSLEYAINNHNSIAKQMGISYIFTMPVIDESEWVRSIDDPCLMVLFQGYPIRDQIHTYNRMVIAGAKVSKKDVYYLEQKDWYFLYHKSDCSEINSSGLVYLDEPHDTVLECVEKGAFACKLCLEGKGVFPPNYNTAP